MTAPTLKQRAERLREVVKSALSVDAYEMSDYQREGLIEAAETLLRLMEEFPAKMYEASEYEQGFNYCRAEVLKIIEGENV